MNNNYYQSPIYPNTNLNNNMPTFEQQKRNNYPEKEQYYIENIIKLNKGKPAKIHITAPSNKEWQEKIFEGTIKEVGNDYIIITEELTGQAKLIPLIYLLYISFPESINY